MAGRGNNYGANGQHAIGVNGEPGAQQVNEKSRKDFLRLKVYGTTGWCVWCYACLLGTIIYGVVNASSLDAEGNSRAFIGITYFVIMMGSYIFSLQVREYERESDKDAYGLRPQEEIQTDWCTLKLRVTAASVFFGAGIIAFIVAVAMARRMVDGVSTKLSSDGINSCVGAAALILLASMQFMNNQHNRSDARSFERL
jgi:hypothetical protein